MPLFTMKTILTFTLKYLNGEEIEEKDLWPHHYIDHKFDHDDPLYVSIPERFFDGFPCSIEKFSKKIKENYAAYFSQNDIHEKGKLVLELSQQGFSIKDRLNVIFNNDFYKNLYAIDDELRS